MNVLDGPLSGGIANCGPFCLKAKRPDWGACAGGAPVPCCYGTRPLHHSVYGRERLHDPEGSSSLPIIACWCRSGTPDSPPGPRQSSPPSIRWRLWLGSAVR